jgi:MFS family permease
MSPGTQTATAHDRPAYGLPFVIGASSVGTIVAWYDVYLYAVLASYLAPLFFPSDDATASLLAALAIFGIGFAVRPLGGVVFGHIGDRLGRRYAFLITVTLMGLGSAAIGVLPGYSQIGVLAPVFLVVLRVLQGLAVGGEYGGAIIYVAEHAPDRRRGFLTSWVQTTATISLVLALAVILSFRVTMSTEAFAAWGWRLPFLVSCVLVVVALYVRVRLRETPLFSRLKTLGKSSASPLEDSLGNARNRRLILLVLFGATAGQAVVWYQAQFQARTYLERVLHFDSVSADLVMIAAMLLGTPLIVFFGALSDRIGRKPIVMGGCLLAAVTFYPIYALMAQVASSPWQVGALVWLQMLYMAMMQGPMAAFLVEFFPARVRYTSLAIAYNLGSGGFGGWLPFIAVAIVAATGNPLSALAYPIAVAGMTFIVGTLFVRETRTVRIWDEVGGEVAHSVASPASNLPQSATIAT